MEIKVNTKFSIGDHVFILNPISCFRQGNFITTYSPNKESKIITSITIHQSEATTKIVYHFRDGAVSNEKYVFETLEKANQYCSQL